MSRAELPVTRYAKTPDGVHIAYNVVGEGPLDLVLLSEWALPLEGRWQEPTIARPLERLASFSRLISFDKRGIGCSDPVPLRDLTAVEEWMHDVRTVMDEVGSERAALFAANESGPVAVLFAATYPDRVTALVLVDSMVRWLASEDYPWGIPVSAHAKLLDSVEEDWVTGSTLPRVVPTIAADERLMRWYLQGRRLQVSPATARAMYAAWAGIDARPVLPLVQCPTLVVHRAENYVVRVQHGRHLAQHIRGAKYVELPGADTMWWASDSDRIVDEVEDFLTGARASYDSDRVLATVLFTDMVRSTERASSLGDRAWHDLLDRYRSVVRALIRQFRGREVNTRGDDFLATFDGPARAVRCALAIGSATVRLGIQVRSGLHTGEIEAMGDDIGGIAVHIGARVGELADAGEVLVSGTVVDLVAGSGIEFAARGEHELKGVPGRWRLYSVDR